MVSNVIDLCRYRNRRNRLHFYNVFYVTEEGQWLTLLLFSPFLRVRDLRSQEELRNFLLIERPDLIIVESNISWGEPIEIIREFHEKLAVPIVLVCDNTRSAKDKTLIKKAYSAGVHDVLFAPLRRDEIVEAIDVLLKFRMPLSIQQ
ncbi:MAG: hypothetical protein HY537_07765 [Deltaproteobacteria bacterium]|nr:hypothetical protein [Deltaproteobacteria bacterium]